MIFYLDNLNSYIFDISLLNNHKERQIHTSQDFYFKVYLSLSQICFLKIILVFIFFSFYNFLLLFFFICGYFTIFKHEYKFCMISQIDQIAFFVLFFHLIKYPHFPRAINTNYETNNRKIKKVDLIF